MRKQEFSLPVYSTEDYLIFSSLTGNRDIYPRHVRRLVKVIEKNPEFTKNNPIKVNKDLAIIDGQHRTEAFKAFAAKKGLTPSLYYVIMEDGGISDAQAMNAGSKAWIPGDYAKAYAAEGNPHYKQYLEVAKEFENLPHNVVARYLGGSEGAVKAFKHGDFEVKNLKEGKDSLKKLEEISTLIKGGAGQAFGLAFHKIVRSNLYDQARMIEQMDKFKDALNSIPNRAGELMVALNMVYNFRNPQKVDLLQE